MRKSPLYLLAAAAAAGALAIPAWSASTPPQLTSFSVGAVHTSSGGLKFAVSGSIDCTAAAHFHVWFWLYQPSRGALAHVYFPPTLGSRVSKKQIAKRVRSMTCTGAAKTWALRGRAEGKHPTAFAAGAAQVCTVVSVSHSRRYVLQSNCTNITLA